MCPNWPGSLRSAWAHGTASPLKLRFRGVHGASEKTLLRPSDQTKPYTVLEFSKPARKIPCAPQCASEWRKMVHERFSPFPTHIRLAYPSTHKEMTPRF